MAVVELETKAKFDDFLKENDLVAVDFYANWCGPCRMISPKFISFSQEYPSIKFGKVNVDENTEASESEKISAMPTFKFYKNGSQFDELVGASEAKLKEKLEKLRSA